MYQFYNAHPQGKIVRDCVKRAISKAANMDYHEVSLLLNRQKKITGAKKFNIDKNYQSFIENVLEGFKISFPAVAGKPRMNGERFCRAYPRGAYILRMAGHLTACVNGVIYDTWDCSDKCVYTAWEIPNAKSKEIYDQIEKIDAEIGKLNRQIAELKEKKNQLMKSL